MSSTQNTAKWFVLLWTVTISRTIPELRPSFFYVTYWVLTCSDLPNMWKTPCNCVSWCRFEYLFNFDNTFEIHDDIEVLKRMGMSFGLESGKCSLEDLKLAKSLVPKALEGYITGMLSNAFTCLWLNVQTLTC